VEELEQPQVSERSRVEAWRLQVLLDTGYPLPLAERIAGSADVDLHQAVDLVVKGGCIPELAGDILL
jgi:hypothetical protein